MQLAGFYVLCVKNQRIVNLLLNLFGSLSSLFVLININIICQLFHYMPDEFIVLGRECEGTYRCKTKTILARSERLAI